MAKRQHRIAHSIGPEGEALLRKLTAHPSMRERATKASGRHVSASHSNTIELLIRREATRLGITVTDEEIDAAKRNAPIKATSNDPMADLRALEDAFSPRFSG